MATQRDSGRLRIGLRAICVPGQHVRLSAACPATNTETALLTGELEPTNEGYALAKIAGLKLCQMYRRQYGVLFHSLMPTNLYGPGDNYHPDHAHVLPALCAAFTKRKRKAKPAVTIWGTGSPLREFLHVDDLASAVLHVATLDDPPDWVNVGSGDEVSILELAPMVAEVRRVYGRESLPTPLGRTAHRGSWPTCSLLGRPAGSHGLRSVTGLQRTYRRVPAKTCAMRLGAR